MNELENYRDAAITTQNKGRLIVILYEGAIKFVNQAIRDIDNKNYEAKGRDIQKAQDIIMELNTVLDMEAGGEIAQNLRSLYNFMSRHLVQANVKSDTQILRDVLSILEELNQGWRAITC
jgi:flagellar protein FliS